MRTYWRDPGYWQWLWHERFGKPAKATLLVVAALALAFAGYAGAGGLNNANDAATYTTKRVVTVYRKAASGSPRLVTQVVTHSETVTAPGKTDVVTVRRNGRTVVLSAPRETVTVHGPVQERVVTRARTQPVVHTVTADRPTTVTAPAATVTTPGATVTTTAPAVTVLRTVTEPPKTVTETTTAEQTVTDTVTDTITDTVTATATTTTKR